MPLPIQNFVDQKGPVVSAAWLNMVDQVVTNGLGQLTTPAQIAAFLGLPSTPVNFLYYGVDSGIINGYIVTPVAGPATLATGTVIQFSALHPNTGPSTINFGGFGADSCVDLLGNPLTGGEIIGLTFAQWNGSSWTIIANPDQGRTQAEINAGVMATNPFYSPGDCLRYGFVPNVSTGSTPQNNAALFVQYFNSTIANGPTGEFRFTNTGTASNPDTYYFDFTNITTPPSHRAGLDINLCDCTLNFFSSTGTNTNLNFYGFFTAAFDFTCRNGTIVVNYPGNGPSTPNGSPFRIGSRSGYGWGPYPTGIFDQDNLVANGLPLQGNIKLQNLRIFTNNTENHGIELLGGLRNITLENIWIDGQGVVLVNGIYYEYGWSSVNGFPADDTKWTSSHATNIRMHNIMITNLATGGSSCGIGMRGAWDCELSNIYMNTMDQGFDLSPGEAFYYRPWAQDAVTPVRNHVIKNWKTINVAFPGALVGGGPVSGYLTGVINALPTPQRYQAQTDLLNINVDGFEFLGCSTGLEVVGQLVSVRNGSMSGGGVTSSGGLLIGLESMHTTVENVQVLNFNGSGVRFGSPGAVWSPTRPGFFSIRNCKIAGNTIGFALSTCQSGIIENCQIGFNTLYDVAAESTQSIGIDASTTSGGVICRNNFVTTSGGTNAYVNLNSTTGAGNTLLQEKNLPTSFSGGGEWLSDLITTAAQVIATSGTITTLNFSTIRLAPPGAVTGIIMPLGQYQGQTKTLINESAAASTITFAASGTSHVAGGTGVVLAGLSKLILTYDTGTGLWY